MALKGLSQTTSKLIEKLKNGYSGSNTSPSSSVGNAKRSRAPKGEYASMAREVIEDYLDREDFSYNVNTDKLYSQYSDKYKKAGETAMRDTVAKASELSGGYANSYAVNAGMQAYTDHLDDLNDILPELEARAYDRYLDEADRNEEQIDMLLGLDETEYERYRDNMSDFFADREFYEDAYRYREDSDMEMYKALTDYILEIAGLENDDYFSSQELELAIKDLGIERENNKYDFYLGLLDSAK